ncbi:MAG: CoA pyrophosphatase [Thermoproteus sp.]
MCLKLEVPSGGPNTAAVALLVRGRSFLVIKRAERPGDPWSGQVGFPGGRWKPGEDLMGTVRREVEEEVGLRLDPDSLRGVMDPDSPMNAPNLLVYPFVFQLGDVGELNVKADEVAGFRWVTREELKEVEWRGRPAFEVGGWIIWGLTYRFIKRAIACHII